MYHCDDLRRTIATAVRTASTMFVMTVTLVAPMAMLAAAAAVAVAVAITMATTMSAFAVIMPAVATAGT